MKRKTLALVAGVAVLAGTLGACGQSRAADKIESAYGECGEPAGITLADDGASILLDGAGQEDPGAALEDIACVIAKLDIPDSIILRMENTRALDGTQTGQWDGFVAYWTFHPDAGLDIIIETEK